MIRLLRIILEPSVISFPKGKNKQTGTEVKAKQPYSIILLPSLGDGRDGMERLIWVTHCPSSVREGNKWEERNLGAAIDRRLLLPSQSLSIYLSLQRVWIETGHERETASFRYKCTTSSYLLPQYPTWSVEQRNRFTHVRAKPQLELGQQHDCSEN